MLTLVLSDYMKCVKYKQGKVLDMCLCFHVFHVSSREEGEKWMNSRERIYRLWWEVRAGMSRRGRLDGPVSGLRN